MKSKRLTPAMNSKRSSEEKKGNIEEPPYKKNLERLAALALGSPCLSGAGAQSDGALRCSPLLSRG